MRKLFALFVALLVMAGCGGGGAAAGGGNAQVTAFASDSVNDDFDHVWVKLFKVEVVGDSQRFTVLEDAAGRDVDLKTLHDATGPKFSFLDTASVPVGTYKQVNVTLGKTVTLFPKGSATGTDKQFDDRFNDPNDPAKSLLVMPAPGLVVAGKVDIVVDFDLATWLIQANGRINGFIKHGGENGLGDHHRHVDDDFDGKISSLSGTDPNFTFTLSRGPRHVLTVQTDATTEIRNSDGSPNPQLANGQEVEVRGAVVAGVLMATAIKIKIGDDDQEDANKIVGSASNLDATAGAFDLLVARAFGFIPDATTYRVTTTASTRYLSDAGAVITQAEFFAQLAVSPRVEAEGTASAGGHFVAAKLKLEGADDGVGDHHAVEVKGPIVSIGATSFTMTVRDWHGSSLRDGETLTVNVDTHTLFGPRDHPVDKATFFASVTVGSVVEVEGLLRDHTVTAARVKLDN